MSLVDETKASLEAATHLSDKDKGAVEALLLLARKIDAWDQIVAWALEDVEDVKGARPVVPQNDNVSISAYFKACDQLGLTPSGRKSLGLSGGGVSDKKAKLTALRGGKAAG